MGTTGEEEGGVGVGRMQRGKEEMANDSDAAGMSFSSQVWREEMKWKNLIP